MILALQAENEELEGYVTEISINLQMKINHECNKVFGVNYNTKI